eukprot:scaffold12276_cov122-Isochrysis_galbana.AAC.1
MELKPADARAAPSASAPTTMSMAMPLPHTHPHSPVKGNMVSQRAKEHGLSTSTTPPPVRPKAHKPEPARALHITPPLRVGVSSLQTAGLHSVSSYRVAAQQYNKPQGTSIINITAIAPRAQAGSCQSLAHQASGRPCVSAFPVFIMLGSTLCGAKRSQHHRTISSKRCRGPSPPKTSHFHLF